MRSRLLWAVLFAASLAVPTAAWAWEIANFDVRVTVHEDATATVQETILADFTGESKHGIFRDIPIHYEDRAGQHFRLRLRVSSVTDQTGQPWPYRLESAGRYQRIRIGDPDLTLTGRQVYQIIYEVQRGAVRFFPDHDECYWNLTGNEWQVPMHRVRAVIELPPAAHDVRAIAYLGAYGSRGQLQPQLQGFDVVVFEPSGPLAPYEGLTAAVSWAKGAVQPPSAMRVLGWWVEDNWCYGLPVLVFLGMLWLWAAKGRDPRPSRSEVVEYAPPEGLTPAEAGTLLDQAVDLRDITATLIDLAVRGYLRIEPITTSMLGLHHVSDYRYVNLKSWEADKTIKSHERTVLRGVFGSPGNNTLLSHLNEVFYTNMPDIRDNLYSTLVLKGYFDSHPDHIRRRYLVAGIAFSVLLCWLLQTTQPWHQVPSVGLVIAAILSGVIIAAYSRVMPRRTLKGAAVTDRIAGFLEFMRRTDQDRLVRMKADPQLFERCLPYALVFGIATQWARAFEGLYKQPPTWYAGTWDTFSTRGFSNSLNHMLSSTNSSFTSRPRSSGSSSSWGGGSSSSWGGSGGGGGGFSGGGGGGGGGGSW